LNGVGEWAARDLIGVVARERDGQAVEAYRLYRVVGGAAVPDAVVLPRR